MDPNDFLALAVKLAAANSAAELCSAVSRGYYGLFHLAVALMANGCGIRTPIHQGHNKACQRLRNSGCAPAVEVGRLLDSLRLARTSADYDLNNSDAQESRWVRRHIADRQYVQSKLAECWREPLRTQLADGIRRYCERINEPI